MTVCTQFRIKWKQTQYRDHRQFPRFAYYDLYSKKNSKNNIYV